MNESKSRNSTGCVRRSRDSDRRLVGVGMECRDSIRFDSGWTGLGWIGLDWVEEVRKKVSRVTANQRRN